MEKDFYHREEVLISLGMMEYHGKTENRETWITCRMVLMYIVWESCLGDKESPALVHGAVHGLLEELKDRENGGWYPGITPDNKFLPDKQCYAHAFVLLAASSALLAGEKDAETLLKDALELFDKRFWDENRLTSMIPEYRIYSS